MVAQVVKHWDVFIDGIQILLCLLILVYLFRNRSESKKFKMMKTETGSGYGFNAQVLTQTIRQETDQAFANIIETITVEQNRLENVLQFGRREDEAFGISEFEIQSKLLNKNRVSRRTEQTTGSDEKHVRIQNLALGGMSTKQISEKLKTPLGEVELVLDLRNESS